MLVYLSFNKPFDNLELNRFVVSLKLKQRDMLLRRKFGCVNMMNKGEKKWLADKQV